MPEGKNYVPRHHFLFQRPAALGYLRLLRAEAAGHSGVRSRRRHVGRCIRTGRWEYSVSAPDRKGWEEPDSEVYVEEFLYDLQADPHERNNLVAEAEYAQVRAELAERLKRRMAEAGERVAEVRPVSG